MTIDDKKDIQDALNILSEMIDKEIIDDTPIPTNFIHRPSYSKAIDDFAEKIIQRYHELPTTLGYTEEIVKEIAQQLKAGVED